MVPGSPSRPATRSWRQRMKDSDCALCSATATRSSVVGSTTCSAPRAPRWSSRRSKRRTPAYAERWIRTVRAEYLDWLLIIGRGHLEQVLRRYVEHYNQHRPHRALGLEPPDPLAGLTLVSQARRVPGTPTRPSWWLASGVPASCMNAFTHPTRCRARIDRRRAAQERTGKPTRSTPQHPRCYPTSITAPCAQVRSSNYSTIATTLPLACPSPRYRCASGTSRNG